MNCIASDQYGLANNIHVIPTARYYTFPYILYFKAISNPKIVEIMNEASVKLP